MVQQAGRWLIRGSAGNAIVLLLLSTVTYAQDSGIPATEDVWAIRPEYRTSAETPIPYGLIISGHATGIAMPNGEDNNETGADADLEIAAYYDVWQFAIRHRSHGNVVQLMIRSPGRDIYSGLFVEFGNMTVISRNVNSVYPNSRDTTMDAGTISVGYRWASGYSSNRSFVHAGEGSLVLLDKNQGVVLQYGAGIRIPFGLSGLVTCLQLKYSFFNWVGKRPSYIGDAQSQIGLAVMIQYGLNSEFR